MIAIWLVSVACIVDGVRITWLIRAMQVWAVGFDFGLLIIYLIPFAIAAFTVIGMRRQVVPLLLLFLTIAFFGFTTNRILHAQLDHSIWILEQRANGRPTGGLMPSPPLVLAGVECCLFYPLVLAFALLAMSRSHSKRENEQTALLETDESQDATQSQDNRIQVANDQFPVGKHRTGDSEHFTAD
jgi:hypothetical protein